MLCLGVLCTVSGEQLSPDTVHNTREFMNKGNECIHLLHTTHNYEKKNIDDNWNIF
jgi:hypothetical protein